MVKPITLVNINCRQCGMHVAKISATAENLIFQVRKGKIRSFGEGLNGAQFYRFWVEDTRPITAFIEDKDSGCDYSIGFMCRCNQGDVLSDQLKAIIDSAFEKLKVRKGALNLNFDPRLNVVK